MIPLKRLDVYLVENGYFKTRHQAQIEIKHQRIKINNQVSVKPSTQIKDTDTITVLKAYNPYVSLGGLKLEKAINDFKLDFTNLMIVDVGSSTGGFTDCALKHGAKGVIAIDVGTQQMVEVLRKDKRVNLMEKTNFLTLDKPFSEPIDYTLMDVSFTSSLPLIQHANALFNASLIVLIKPQFESLLTPKSGIIKDIKLHKKILSDYQTTLNKHQLYIQKLTFSPLKGGSGNIEFLALINQTTNYIQTDNVVISAHDTLK